MNDDAWPTSSDKTEVFSIYNTPPLTNNIAPVRSAIYFLLWLGGCKFKGAYFQVSTVHNS